jgi:hypothetical protein
VAATAVSSAKVAVVDSGEVTCTEIQYAILWRERCLKMLQNSIAYFQELRLSFVRFDVSA